MNDLIGREINLNDIVGTSSKNSQITLWRVTGFTQQKVVLDPVRQPARIWETRKYPNQLIVIPDAVDFLERNQS